jgi:hypothetical protein
MAVHPFKKPCGYKRFTNLNTDGHGSSNPNKAVEVTTVISYNMRMKVAFHSMLLAAMFLGAAGCAAPRANMQSWLGRPEADLVASWGAPQTSVPDHQGGKVLIYSPETRVSNAESPGQVTVEGGAISTFYHYNQPPLPAQLGYGRGRAFYVNGDGIIYNWGEW